MGQDTSREMGLEDREVRVNAISVANRQRILIIGRASCFPTGSYIEVRLTSHNDHINYQTVPEYRHLPLLAEVSTKKEPTQHRNWPDPDTRGSPFKRAMLALRLAQAQSFG